MRKSYPLQSWRRLLFRCWRRTGSLRRTRSPATCRTQKLRWTCRASRSLPKSPAEPPGHTCRTQSSHVAGCWQRSVGRVCHNLAADNALWDESVTFWLLGNDLWDESVTLWLQAALWGTGLSHSGNKINFLEESSIVVHRYKIKFRAQ